MKIQENIKAGKYNLYLSEYPENEASLINVLSHMLSMEADNRPSASAVLKHPAFWRGQKTEDFIREVTGWLENDDNLYRAQGEIERNKHFVFMGSDWTERVPEEILEDLMSHFRPDGSSLYKLLK